MDSCKNELYYPVYLDAGNPGGQQHRIFIFCLLSFGMKIRWKLRRVKKFMILFLVVFSMFSFLSSTFILYLDTDTKMCRDLTDDTQKNVSRSNPNRRNQIECAFFIDPGNFTNTHASSADKGFDHISTINRTKQTENKDDSSDFISVGTDDKLFMYSAFLVKDLRSKLTSIKIIAVTSIASTKFPVSCYVKFETGSEIVNGIGELVPEPYYGFRYRSALIKCSPTNHNLQPVSITVSINGGSMSLPVLLTYPNNRKSTITRCYPAIHSSMNDVNLFLQSIEMSRAFGADYFVFYNVSIGPDVEKIIEFYETRKIVEVLPWTLPVSSKAIHYHGQFATLHDCLLRNRETSDYIFFGDLDEIPVPRKHQNWRDMLQSSSKRQKNGCSAWNLLHAFFPTFQINWPLVPSKLIMRGHGSHSEALTKSFIKTIFQETANLTGTVTKLNLTFLNSTIRARAQDMFARSKYFVSPKGIDVLSIHKVKRFSAVGYCLLPADTALLHHYRSIWAVDMIPPWSRDETLLEFKDVIIERFRSLFQELELGS